MNREFKVYYRKEPMFRLDEALTREQVTKEQTHAYLTSVYTTDVESVFYRMQAEVWSPNGEARPLIQMKGLHHTSMSVGDVVLDVQGDVMWQADMAGWKEVRKMINAVDQERERITAELQKMIAFTQGGGADSARWARAVRAALKLAVDVVNERTTFETTVSTQEGKIILRG